MGSSPASASASEQAADLRAPHLRVHAINIYVRDQDASWELNEPDAYALEESLRLREKHGGEVIVANLGLEERK